MDNKIRHLFLEKWTYPKSPSEAVALDEVKPLEGQFLAVAGRLSQDYELQGARTTVGLTLPEGICLTGSEFSAEDVLKPGDLIWVRGPWKSGRIHVDRIDLLVPNKANSIPSFYEHEFSPEWAKLWQEYQKAIRDFFTQKSFLETRTPTLVPSPGTEPFLIPFTTTWKMGKDVREFYLPTSPELHLKKLLVRGFSKIFEFKDCFRNGEVGPHHQSEFVMLEWYRAYQQLESIQQDVKELVAFLIEKFSDRAAKILVKKTIQVETKTMSELFQEKLQFSLTPKTSLKDLQGLAQKEDIHFDSSDSWNDVFFRIFIERIEPELGLHHPLLVTHYPPSQVAYARLTESGWADRFEFYWKGLEIANAFHELNDPAEQRKRFDSDLAEQRRQGRTPVQLDEEFLEALEFGMPPSAGIALGAERLFMALFDFTEISHLRAFPIHRGD